MSHLKFERFAKDAKDLVLLFNAKYNAMDEVKVARGYRESIMISVS